jgi:hypothetical protein
MSTVGLFCDFCYGVVSLLNWVLKRSPTCKLSHVPTVPRICSLTLDLKKDLLKELELNASE